MGIAGKLADELDGIIADMGAHAEEWAVRPGKDFTRDRKLPFVEVVGMLLSMGPDSIGIEAARSFGYAADAPRTSAFCQARAKLKPEALRALLVSFASRCKPGEYRGVRPVACDGTGVALPRDSLEPSTAVPPNGSSPEGRNAIHCTALYDVLGRLYLDCVVQPESGRNEFAAFCEMCDRWPYGGRPLFIMDRGIASYNVYAHAAESGAYFLVRIDDRKAARLLGRPLPDCVLDEEVSLILSRSTASSRMRQPGRRADYRLVDKGVRFDYIDEEHPEYEIGLRVARFPIGDRGEMENVVTNLPAGEFPTGGLKDVYWMRWGIETSFRDLKHTVGASRPHSSRLGFAAMEVWGRMTLYNLCSSVAACAAEEALRGREGRRLLAISFAFAAKACHDFLRARGRGQARAPDPEPLIRRNLLPVRPGRKYERRPRFQVPPAFAYRLS